MQRALKEAAQRRTNPRVDDVPEDSGVTKWPPYRKRGGFVGAEAEVRRVGGTFGPPIIRAWRAYLAVQGMIPAERRKVISDAQMEELELHYAEMTYKRGLYCSMQDWARAVSDGCLKDSELSLLEQNEALRAELERTRNELAQWRMDREAAE